MESLFRIQGERKIQLKMEINFIYSKDSDEYNECNE